MSTMSILFDVVTVVLLVSIICASAAKGFLRSVIELAGYLLSFAVAAVLSVPLGAWIYEHLLKSVFEKGVSDYINSTTGSAKQAFDQMLGSWHIGADTVGAGIANSLAAAKAAALGGIVGRGIAFLALFMLCMAAVGVIAHAADIVNRLPVIGGINKLGGALIGAVKALLVMFILCTVVAVCIPIFSVQKNPPFTNNTVNSTYVFKYIYQINPVRVLLKK